MTQREIISKFIDYLRISLTEINELYYGLHYWNNTTYAIPYENVQFKRYLERYHERVFCYELYFRLRTKMETFIDENHINIFSHRNIYLQSELRKDRIHTFIEWMFKVEKLSREFMPDFLLHTPGNFDNQLIVMEIKSNPNLSIREMAYDLLKIQEFIVNYKYRQGIFIATNIADHNRLRIMGKITDWIRKNISTPESIKLIFKSEPTSDLVEFDLNEIL